MNKRHEPASGPTPSYAPSPSSIQCLMQSGPASLSRYLQSTTSGPVLIHSLHEHRSSVLSLAADDDYIFSGSQNQDISVNPLFLHFYLSFDIAIRSGTRRLLPSRTHSMGIQPVYWLWSMQKINNGYLVLQARFTYLHIFSALTANSRRQHR